MPDITLEDSITMRKRLMGMVGAVAAATVMALVGGTTPAHAATFSVGPGPAGTTFNFAGTAGTTLLTDTTTGTQLTCSSSTAAGNGRYGPSQAGAGIARITNTTFSNCSGPLGISFTVTHAGTWLLNAVTPGAGTVDGTITNISARLSGPLCSATVTGSVPARFFNSTPTTRARLQVLPTNPGTLTISGVSGCFGLIRSGDRANFSGTYTINTPTQLVITSP